jgi:hypothetical protein
MRMSGCLVGAAALLSVGVGCTEPSPTLPAISSQEGAGARMPNANTIVVTRGAEAGWTLMAVGRPAVSQVTIAAPADERVMRAVPSKVGERGVRLHVGVGQTEGAFVRTLQFAGTPLADLTALSYRMFVVERGRDDVTPLLTLAIDLNGDGFVDDQLLFQPTAALGRWQTWDALHGDWQSNSRIGDPDARGMRSLAAYSAAAPNARLVSALTIGAWRVAGNRPLVAAIDDVAVGIHGRTTVFRFGSALSEGTVE